MILILKYKDQLRVSSEQVADWIDYLGGEYRFLSGNDFLDGNMTFCNELDGTNEKFVITSSEKNREEIDLRLVNVVWCRGFVRHREFTKKILQGISSTNDNISELKLRVVYALRKITGQLFARLKSSYQLPDMEAMKVDKWETLKLAQVHGIQIPRSIVTNSASKLLTFIDSIGCDVISKSLYEGVFFNDAESIYFFKTQLITKSVLEDIPESFFPSLFQEYIEKQYELRIFFLEGKFYSMAIFSQLDEQTKIDFRNYNETKPNRTVPYCLPSEIETKLGALMRDMNLNTGSIDMIRSKDGGYYFLEVNPTGQFGMTSFPCNYFLEKKIAEVLIKEDLRNEG
ncbi:MAG: grasp-with-spasm system ATP-grasp peptide maturase [Bacteroidota bacterium]